MDNAAKRYTNSSKVEKIKLQYRQRNLIPNTGEFQNLTMGKSSSIVKKQKEFSRLKDDITGMLPMLQDVQHLNLIISQDEDLGDVIAENALDAIAEMNRDMRCLAANAYQLKDLMNISLEENDLAINWMNKLEQNTIKQEDGLLELGHRVDAFVKKATS